MFRTLFSPPVLEFAVAVEVLGTKVGPPVGIAVGMATVVAIAGATVAGKPALTSAACKVLLALASFIVTVEASRFVIAIVVIATPAARIRRPVMVMCRYN
jgi:hypothetical protein